MNESSRVRGTTICVWLRSVVLALAAAIASSGMGARAQDQAPASTPGDVFASQGGPPIYSDQYSSDCEASNANNPYAGMNPLTCHGEMMPAQGNACNLPGMTLIRQIGNNCFYCLAINPPIQGVILPIDAAGLAEKQGFRCAVDEADACMLICTGTGKYVPPPGVRLMSGPPGTPPTTVSPPMLTPANPTLPKNPCYQLKSNYRKFTAAQLKILDADLASAKAILLKAKTYTDKNPWDEGTQAISKKYYGDASPTTQKQIRQDIDNVLNVLSGTKDATSVIYPSGADLYGPPVNGSDWAYTYQGSDPVLIFLNNSFWQPAATGPDSQPMILLHELSHLPGGANTLDFAYGQGECVALVFYTTTAVGKALVSGALRLPPEWVRASVKKQLETLSQASPLNNADSFKYFVYEVANQK